MTHPPRSLLLTWVALLALVAATLGLAYAPMPGPLNLIVAMGISAAKTVLVVVIFMKLLRASALTRAAAVAGLFWLAILFALSATDYLTRTDAPVDTGAPPTIREDP